MERTQQGNNNPYCQDNEVSWFNWDLSEGNEALLAFARQLIEFRRQHPVFRQDSWLDRNDIRWFNPDGSEIDEDEWQNSVLAIGIFLNGARASPSDIRDDSFFLCFNAGDETIEFLIPSELQDREWQVVIDTAKPTLEENCLKRGSLEVEVGAQSLVGLKCQ